MRHLAALFLLCASFCTAQQRTIEQDVDLAIFRSINNLRADPLDLFIPAADRAILPSAFLIPPLLFTLGRANDNTYDENTGYLTGITSALTFCVTFGLKNSVQRNRPFQVLDGVYYTRRTPFTDIYSFPSGHTSTAFALAAAITIRYPDNELLIASMYGHAALIAYGRMYLGVHYPSDVLFGMALGTGAAFLVHGLRKELLDFKNTVLKEETPDEGTTDFHQYAIIGTMLAADLYNIIFHPMKPGDIERTRIEPTGQGLRLVIPF